MPSKGTGKAVGSGNPTQPSRSPPKAPVHSDEILYNSPLKSAVFYIEYHVGDIVDTDLLHGLGKRKKTAVQNEPRVKKTRWPTTERLSTHSTDSKNGK